MKTIKIDYYVNVCSQLYNEVFTEKGSYIFKI